MRAVLQRVTRASVKVDDQTVGAIDHGLLVLLGAGEDDGPEDLEWILRKLLSLRIFADESGRMNLSVQDVGGALLVVSQFTLYGDCRRGRRPSFDKAMEPVQAEAIYEEFVSRARQQGVPVETGRFGAMMQVELSNDGPVTLLLDSRRAA